MATAYGTVGVFITHGTAILDHGGSNVIPAYVPGTGFRVIGAGQVNGQKLSGISAVVNNSASLARPSGSSPNKFLPW